MVGGQTSFFLGDAKGPSKIIPRSCCSVFLGIRPPNPLEPPPSPPPLLAGEGTVVPWHRQRGGAGPLHGSGRAAGDEHGRFFFLLV